MRAGIALLSWLTLGAVAPERAVAQSEPLVIALEAYRTGELDVALERFDEALRVPGNSPGELVQIHLHLGILRATVREPEVARREMEAALAIDPTLEPPSEMGPDARALFDRVRQERGGRALRLGAAAAGPVRHDGPTTLRIALTDAPDGLVASLRVLAAPPGAAEPADLVLRGVPASVELPPSVWGGSRALAVAVEALDAHGGVLARAELRLDALLPGRDGDGAAASGAAREDDDDDDDEGAGGGFFSTAWPWIGLAVLVGAGVTAGVLLFGVRDEYAVGAPEVIR